jgi:divalent metal cation (Fe/Co/Zn/Cd) transporter
VLEALTILHHLVAAGLCFALMGNSQVMKTEALENLLGTLTPCAFLVSAAFCDRPPTPRFPYGFRRAASIAFLAGSLTLAGLGGMMLVDGLHGLATGWPPTIGSRPVFGQLVWMGWPMLAVLLLAAVPEFFLGRAKLPVAKALRDRALWTDATVDAANWKSNLAAIAGIAGLAVGFGKADALFASLIALDILHDGLRALVAATADLMDQAPRTIDGRAADPLPARLHRAVARLPWVRGVEVRIREEGRVLCGEVHVLPCDQARLADRVDEVVNLAHRLDRRLADLAVHVVRPEDKPAPLRALERPGQPPGEAV